MSDRAERDVFGELYKTLAARHGGDANVRAEPSAAIEVDLGSLWRTPT